MRLGFSLFSDMMETVVLESGVPVVMSIQRVMDGDDPDLDFNTPRLVAKTRKSSIVKVGDTLAYQDRHYIVGRRSHTPDYNSWWLFEGARRVRWERHEVITDTLTQLPKSSSPVHLGDVWMAWEIMARQPLDRDLGISNEVSRVITGEDVQLGDLVDGQQVKRVLNSMGLRIVEVQ